MDADTCLAVRHLLSAIGYEGKMADSRNTDMPFVLMEVDPEDVQWLKVHLLSADKNGFTFAVSHPTEQCAERGWKQAQVKGWPACVDFDKLKILSSRLAQQVDGCLE